MAEIAPFKGVFYNPEKIDRLADVVTPPYDVISPQEQERYHELHPNNMIHLILGKPDKRDTPDNNPHTRAAQYFSQWTRAEILKRDKRPAYYLKSIEFKCNGTHYNRYGLIALVRIEPFEKGIVLPHEKTFSRVKSERLDLIKACNVNIDPIFALFPDSNDLLSRLTRKVQAQDPVLNFNDHDGKYHRLWRITDPDFHKSIEASLSAERLFIADGHHRYETSLNYRDWMMKEAQNFSSSHPANFVMMYLSSMKDPGLTILPAHRLLREVDDRMITTALQRSHDFFEHTSFPFEERSREKIQAEFIAQLHASNTHNAIGLLHKNQATFHLLTLKTGTMEKIFSNSIPAVLREIDVTVLTRLIFMELLGFDQARLDNEQLIGYDSQDNSAIEKVISGEYDAVFILNPTKIEQVRSVALKGLKMPRKSTYFYPKVIAGVVQNILSP